jgi:hypothetical protein
MPAGADVVVPEVELEPEEVVVVSGGVEDVELDVPAEVPADVEVELEVGALAAGEDESGGFVTCWELLAVDELPPLAFAPQPRVAIRAINRREPASVGRKKRCMNHLSAVSSIKVCLTTKRLRKH